LKVTGEQEPRAGIDAGTNIGDALAEALIRLEAAGNRPKVVILLSDGEHNVFKDGAEAPLRPKQAAQLAANLKVKVYTIDAGGVLPSTAPIEEVQQREAGRETLKAVATMTNGQAFEAPNGAALLAAYKEIETLEKRPAPTFQYRRYFEYYPWCAGLAAVLLLVAYVLERTRWLVIG
jgi:Ca-activated chloride channel family protein